MIDLSSVPKIEQKESPLYQAFQRMEDNKPPYPTALIESLGLSKEWDKKSSKPHFNGWHGSVGGNWMIWDWMAIPNGADLDDIAYMGIWRARTASKTHLLWCSIPSFNSGEVKPGESFNPGPERIKIGWKQEDLDDLVRKGYDIIMAKIAELGEYVPEEA